MILNDLWRTTVILEQAASDSGDDFLQYIYGMAVLHLNERRNRIDKRQLVSGSDDIDPRIGKLAKTLLAFSIPKTR